MEEAPLIHALTDQEQFEQAAAWAALCFRNRPNGLAPVVTLGAVSVRMMGALDDPHARVMALHPSDTIGMGVQLGHALLEAAGLLFAAGCHIRDAERAEDARCSGVVGAPEPVDDEALPTSGGAVARPSPFSLAEIHSNTARHEGTRAVMRDLGIPIPAEAAPAPGAAAAPQPPAGPDAFTLMRECLLSIDAAWAECGLSPESKIVSSQWAADWLCLRRALAASDAERPA